MQDVAQFDTNQLPFKCTFMSYSKMSRLTQVSPLFQIPGFSADIIAVDLLHSWHLGGIAEYVGFVFWFIIHSGIFVRHMTTAALDGYKISLIRLKADLWAYYAERSATDPHFKTAGLKVGYTNTFPAVAVLYDMLRKLVDGGDVFDRNSRGETTITT
jgi:hypothetical protein